MSALSRYLMLCFLVAGGLLHATWAMASAPLPEYTVKAGYLYNFAMLTEWPSNTAGEDLELCLIGNDDFVPALETLQGKTVNKRRINVRILTQAGEVKGCHVLFISEVGRSEFAQLKREIGSRPILTVTDSEVLARSGVAIFLRPEGQRLVFEINTNAVRNADLNISARLLRLARVGVGE